MRVVSIVSKATLCLFEVVVGMQEKVALYLEICRLVFVCFEALRSNNSSSKIYIVLMKSHRRTEYSVTIYWVELNLKKYSKIFLVFFLQQQSSFN